MKKLAVLAFAAACGLAHGQTVNVAPPAGLPGPDVKIQSAPLAAPAVAPLAAPRPAVVVKHRKAAKPVRHVRAAKHAPAKKVAHKARRKAR